MSETENPLEPNSSSGGEPASPSEPPIPPSEPPPPPPSPPAQSESVEEVTSLMNEAQIGTTNDDEKDGEGGNDDEVEPDNSGDTGGNADDEGDDDDDDSDSDDDSDDNDDASDNDGMPPEVVRRVEKLRDLNAEREKIMEEYLEQRAKLEKTFESRLKPLYQTRLEVVSGSRDDEIEKEAKPSRDSDDDDEKKEGEMKDDAEGQQIVGIPQFWVCAMSHMEAVAELITERDVDCLEHLRDVTCLDDDDGKGFTLQFHFDETNDYFNNKILIKRYEIPNLLLDDEPILRNVMGCEIDWKAGRCLTYREIKKKQRSKSGKRAGQIRTVTKRERTDSFFHFFSPPKIPSIDDMDEEEADAIEDAFDHDYDVAQAFRSHLIPRAVLWFTGEALDEGFEEAENIIEEGVWPGGTTAAAAAAAASSNPFTPPPSGGSDPPECKQN